MSNNVDFYIVSPLQCKFTVFYDVSVFGHPVTAFNNANVVTYGGLTRSCPNLVVQYWIDTGGC